MSEPDHSLQHRPNLTRIARTPSYDELLKRFNDYVTNNKFGNIDHPIRSIEDHKLPRFLKGLHKKLEGLVTAQELEESAKLAKQDHALFIGQHVDGLSEAEKQSLDVQRSGAFWREPKDLVLTLAVCCLASMVQGWDQVANGNLGWTGEFGIKADLWQFAIVQAVPWFSASILGSYLSDPLSEFTGRRKALFVAAICSLSSSVAGSRVAGWKGLVGTRVLLGLGIGGKASIVPVLESEVLPPSKRGRLLVSWQVFDAAGLFLGAIACYLLRGDWRSQILSGAIPAFALVVATFAACESPRWLIIHGHYPQAFTTLLRLRKERRLALMELVSIHYQTQAERRLFIRREIDDESGPGLNPFETDLGRTSWWERFRNMIYIPRIRRAATAAMIVMICQNLSGINIYAFLATQFYSTAGVAANANGTDYTSAVCLSNNITASEICHWANVTYYANFSCYDDVISHTRFNVTTACQAQLKNEGNSFKFAIGFGAANMIFSCLAYFLVENKEPDDDDSKLTRAANRIFSNIPSFSKVKKRFKDNGSTKPSPKGNDSSPTTKSPKDRPHSGSSLSSVRHIEGPKIAEQSQSVQNSIHQQETGSPCSNNSPEQDDKFPEYRYAPKFRGRRFLLLMSFAAGVVTLFLTSMMFRIPHSKARLPLITFFIMMFTAFYSPGAGAIPFLYCAEIFPNEGRELGMSWSTFWNFLGGGIVALLVPIGIKWGHSKLLGLFSGLNAVAFILVYFCVYTTNHTTTLEDYTYVFGKRMRDHMRAQAMRLWRWSDEVAPRFNWEVGTGGKEDKEDSDGKSGGSPGNQPPQQEAYVLPQITRVSTSRSKKDDEIELAHLSDTSPNR